MYCFSHLIYYLLLMTLLFSFSLKKKKKGYKQLATDCTKAALPEKNN